MRGTVGVVRIGETKGIPLSRLAGRTPGYQDLVWERRRRRLTATGVAKEIGVCTTTYCQCERGLPLPYDAWPALKRMLSLPGRYQDYWQAIPKKKEERHMRSKEQVLTDIRHWAMHRCSLEMELEKADQQGSRAKTDADVESALARIEQLEDQLAEVEAHVPDVPDEFVDEASDVADDTYSLCSKPKNMDVVRGLVAAGMSTRDIAHALLGRGRISTFEQALQNAGVAVAVARKQYVKKYSATKKKPPVVVLREKPQEKELPILVDQTGFVEFMWENIQKSWRDWQANHGGCAEPTTK